MIQTAIVSVPPSTNNLFASCEGHDGKSHRVPTKAYRDWRKANEAGIRGQLKPVKNYPIELVVEIQAGTDFNRRRDIANCEKAVADLLVSLGILKDDNWTCIGSNTQRVRPLDDGTEHSYGVITIREGWRP